MNQLRPGGLDLTSHALSYIKINVNSRLLDIGCGNGESIAFIREKFACYTAGLEPEEQRRVQAIKNNPHCDIKGACAESIPFDDNSFDIVLCECIVSLFTDPSLAFKEIRRVLDDDGIIILTDVYAQGASCASGEGIVRHLYTKRQIINMLEVEGFDVRNWQDCGNIFKNMLGQMILDHGIDKTYQLMGLDKCALKKAQAGYILLIADRRKDE